jgi:hypothetical protein
MMPNRQFDYLFAELAKPFKPEEVKILPKGNKPEYIKRTVVMNRLDEVVGPCNWWDEYSNISDHSAICRLTIRLPDGQELTKCDAGGAAGMSDGGDDDKSIITDAFKRAAVKFGVGRYLNGGGSPVLPSKPVDNPGTTRPEPVVEEEATEPTKTGTEPESQGLAGNPFKAEPTFWNDILMEVANTNGEWWSDHPDDEEIVTTDRVLMKLAELTYEGKVQPVEPGATEVQGKPMTMARWAGVMNKVARKSPEMNEWLVGHLKAFCAEQLRVARTLQKRGTRGPK